jgi:hypothetical protein
MVSNSIWTNELSELDGGLRGLQAAIEVGRRSNTAVPEQPPYGLIVTRSVLEIDRRCSVPELVSRNPKSHRFLNA